MPTNESLDELYVGLDAEFFYRSRDRAETLPAHEFFPSKHDPKVILRDREGAAAGSAGAGVAFHFDGIQAEFNAVESQNVRSIMRRVQHAISHMLQVAKEREVDISFRGAVPVDPKTFAGYPSEAVEFGCDVDFISWLSGDINACEVNPLTHKWRYCGTHLHLGVPDDGDPDLMETLLMPEGRLEVVNVLDFLVGNTATLLDVCPGSTKRRQVYGKAGTFRPTPYGVEYRVLSSFMLASPEILPLLWAFARESVRLVRDGQHMDLFEAVSPRKIITAINTNDQVLARENWHAIRAHLQDFFAEPELSPADGHNPLDAMETLATIGMPSLFPETKLAERWRLDPESFEPIDDTPSWLEGSLETLTPARLG